MAQIRAEFGLVLKHVTRSVENVNTVYCLIKPPKLRDDY